MRIMHNLSSRALYAFLCGANLNFIDKNMTTKLQNNFELSGIVGEGVPAVGGLTFSMAEKN